MKLDDNEKLIWGASAKFEIPNIPSKEDVWENLSQQIEISDNSFNAEKSKPITPMPSIYWLQSRLLPLSFVAIALILAVSSISQYAYTSNTKLSTIAGEIKSIKLPDGSHIKLNAESTISYDKNYNLENRNVRLQGEAYFTISNSNVPFILDTDYGQITVMGTSFNARTRNDGFEIGVTKGSVVLVNDGHSILLEKGQVINTTSNFNNKSVMDISYDEYPDWVNKKFYCKETSLEELCSEIKRTYDIDFHFSNSSLKTITVTGIINAPDLNSVLHTISLLTQHDFKLEGDICTVI